MKLSELKDKISNNTLPNSLLIFVWDDNDFLARQYLHELASKKGQTIQFVNSFEELVGISTNENVFGEDFGDGVLKVFSSDVFDEIPNDSFPSIKNSLIVCNKLSKDVASLYDKYQDLVVKFPKPEDWQTKAYIKYLCQGLGDDSIDRLYQLSKGDIFRLDNEASKIRCFPIGEQEKVFHEMISQGTFDDLAQLGIFNLTNALVKRDMATIGESLRNIKNMDVDAIGLSTILHRNIKNIIDIQMNSKATPESTGMSPKQFNAVRYNCGKTDNGKLIDLLLFLDSLDFKLKSGEFDLPDDEKIDYIVCKMLER